MGIGDEMNLLPKAASRALKTAVIGFFVLFGLASKGIQLPVRWLVGALEVPVDRELVWAQMAGVPGLRELSVTDPTARVIVFRNGTNVEQSARVVRDLSLKIEKIMAGQRDARAELIAERNASVQEPRFEIDQLQLHPRSETWLVLLGYRDRGRESSSALEVRGRAVKRVLVLTGGEAAIYGFILLLVGFALGFAEYVRNSLFQAPTGQGGSPTPLRVV